MAVCPCPAPPNTNRRGGKTSGASKRMQERSGATAFLLDKIVSLRSLLLILMALLASCNGRSTQAFLIVGRDVSATHHNPPRTCPTPSGGSSSATRFTCANLGGSNNCRSGRVLPWTAIQRDYDHTTGFSLGVSSSSSESPTREKKLTVNEKRWMVRFEELQKYKGRFGHCNVPAKWEENPQLGEWVSNQRRYYRMLQEGKKSSMTEERIEKLNAVGFIWNSQDAAWMIRFEELQKFKDRFGHCNVPIKWEDNPQLGSWVHTQRTQYRMLQEGKESQMTAERIEKLNAVGFIWDAQDAAWELRYEQLLEYKDRFGDCNVPQKWEEDPQLATWVMNQRAEYRKLQEGKESSMTEEREDKLNAIGFTWDTQDAAWELRYKQLQEYKDRFGNCNVPKGWEENPQLGKWVNQQRAHYCKLQEGKKSSMTEERIEKLNAIGFMWDAQNAVWELRYEQLQEYKDRFGNCNVPIKWEDNPQLGSWVHTQRTQYRMLQEGKESQMTAERIEKLNAIGFIWDAQNAVWELRYEQLQEYKDRFGNCNVPQKWEEDPQLGSWVTNQRTQYRRLQEGKESSMTEERIERLNALDFEWSLRRR